MFSENPYGADNQQGSRLEVSRLTPQRLHAELLASSTSVALAYLAGASRDGTFSRLHKTMRIAQRERSWLTNLQLLLGKVGSKSWIYREGKRNVWVIETTHRLDERIEDWDHEEKAAFARGYFDAEGGIPQKIQDRFYIQLVQKNLEDLSNLHKLMSELGIDCGRIHNPSHRVDPSYWRFYVKSNSHRDFILRVSSWHLRKRLILESRMKI